MIEMDSIYCISGDLVARNIEGEMVIIPLSSGIGDLSSEMYSLNTTGVAVWEKLDGKKNLNTIIAQIAADYDSPYDTIKDDVMKLISDLSEKKLIIKK